MKPAVHRGVARSLATVLLISAWATCAAAVTPPCPNSGVAMNGAAALSFSSAQWETTTTRSRAAWDLEAGSASAEAWAQAFEHPRVVLDLRDRYVLTGPPPGTPVTITAWLHVTGYVSRSCATRHCGSAFALARLAHAGGGTVERYVTTSMGAGGYGFDLHLAMAVVSGQEFDFSTLLEARADGSAFPSSGSAGIAAGLRFIGLPEGAVIHSCQGMIEGPPTATSRLTWGTLKTRYR